MLSNIQSGDRLGRRLTIVIGSAIYLLGGALQTGANSMGMLMAGRWLAGMGVGFLVMIIPLYRKYIAPFSFGHLQRTQSVEGSPQCSALHLLRPPLKHVLTTKRIRNRPSFYPR